MHGYTYLRPEPGAGVGAETPGFGSPVALAIYVMYPYVYDINMT